MAEGRDATFGEVLTVFDKASLEAATAAGLPALPGLVGSARVTMLGAYENMGGSTTWQSVLPQYVSSATQDIDRIIQAGLTGGLSPQEVSKRLRGYLNGSEPFHQAFGADAWGKLKEGQSKLPPELRESARKLTYLSNRIAFSEIYNARAEAELQHFADDPMIDAVQWQLSPWRGKMDGPDVCDMLARSDFYGMGAGVYPIDKVPPPPHPHDRCERIPRIRDFADYGKPKPSPKRGPSPGTIGKGPYPGVTAAQVSRIREQAFNLLKASESLPPAKGLSLLMGQSVGRAAQHGLTTAETVVHTKLGPVTLPAGTPTKGLTKTVATVRQAVLGSDAALAELGTMLPPQVLAEVADKLSLLKQAGAMQDLAAKIEAEGVKALPDSFEDLKAVEALLAEVKNGNPDALTSLIHDYGVDTKALVKELDASNSHALKHIKEPWAKQISQAIGQEVDTSWSLEALKEMEAVATKAATGDLVAAQELADNYGFTGILDGLEAEAQAAADALAAQQGLAQAQAAVNGAASAPGATYDNIVAHFDAPASGSNKGTGANLSGFYKGKDGVKRYVKFYADPAQARSEALSNALYRKLGANVPDVVLFTAPNGELGLASVILPDVTGTIGTSYTVAEAQAVAEHFADDVLLANWDAVGTGGDNILRYSGGLARVDQGGTLMYRAQGGLKSGVQGYDLHKPTELTSLFDAGKAPDYSKLLKKAGYGSINDMGQGFIAQVDRIEKLRADAGGWGHLLADLAPDMPLAERGKLADMLEKRSEALWQARNGVSSNLLMASPKAAAVITPAPLPAQQALTQKQANKLAKYGVKAPAGMELEAFEALENALAGNPDALEYLTTTKGWTKGGKIKSQMKAPLSSAPKPAPLAPATPSGPLTGQTTPAGLAHSAQVKAAIENMAQAPVLKTVQAFDLANAQPGEQIYAALHGNLKALQDLKKAGYDTGLIDLNLLANTATSKTVVGDAYLNLFKKPAATAQAAGAALKGPAAHAENVKKAIAAMPEGPKVGPSNGFIYGKIDAYLTSPSPGSNIEKVLKGDLKQLAIFKQQGWDTTTLDNLLIDKAKLGTKFDLKGLPKMTPKQQAISFLTQPKVDPFAGLPASAQYADADLVEEAKKLKAKLDAMPAQPAGHAPPSKVTFNKFLQMASNNPGSNYDLALQGDLNAVAELKAVGLDTKELDDYLLKEVLDGTHEDSLKLLTDLSFPTPPPSIQQVSGYVPPPVVAPAQAAKQFEAELAALTPPSSTFGGKVTLAKAKLKAVQFPAGKWAGALQGDLSKFQELKSLGYDTSAVEKHVLAELKAGKKLAGFTPSVTPVVAAQPAPVVALKYGTPAGPLKLSQLEQVIAKHQAAPKKVMWKKTIADLEQKALQGHLNSAEKLAQAGQLTPQMKATLKASYGGGSYGGAVTVGAPIAPLSSPSSLPTPKLAKIAGKAAHEPELHSLDFLENATPSKSGGVTPVAKPGLKDTKEVAAYTKDAHPVFSEPLYFQGGSSTTAGLKASGVSLSKLPQGKIGFELTADTSAPLAHSSSKYTAFAVKAQKPLILTTAEAGATDDTLLAAIRKLPSGGSYQNNPGGARLLLKKNGYDSVVIKDASGSVVKAIVIDDGFAVVKPIEAAVSPGGKVTVPKAVKAAPVKVVKPPRVTGTPGLTRDELEAGRAKLKAITLAREPVVADTDRVLRARGVVQNQIPGPDLEKVRKEIRRSYAAVTHSRDLSHSLQNNVPALRRARSHFIAQELKAQTGITEAKATELVESYRKKTEGWFGSSSSEGGLNWKVLAAENDPRLSVSFNAGYVDHSATLQAPLHAQARASMGSSFDAFKRIAELEQEFAKAFLREMLPPGAQTIKLYRGIGPSVFTGPADRIPALGEKYLSDGNALESWSLSPKGFGGGYVMEAEVPIDDVQQFFLLTKAAGEGGYYGENELLVRGRPRVVTMFKRP